MSELLEPKALSARSALLSLLLGAPGEGLTAQQLVRCGEHLGISEATVRVALSRAVAAGELTRSETTYRLGEQLLARRRRQEEQDALVAWDGAWEVVVVTAVGRSSRDRSTTRTRLARARLAELREGVWMRPANLARSPGAGADDPLRLLRTEPVADPAGLAAELWDLEGWAASARDALALLERTAEPPRRLSVAAGLVRLLATDPLLPTVLLPPDWPAARARARYAAYQAELQAVATGQRL